MDAHKVHHCVVVAWVHDHPAIPCVLKGDVAVPAGKVHRFDVSTDHVVGDHEAESTFSACVGLDIRAGDNISCDGLRSVSRVHIGIGEAVKTPRTLTPSAPRTTSPAKMLPSSSVTVAVEASTETTRLEVFRVAGHPSPSSLRAADFKAWWSRLRWDRTHDCKWMLFTVLGRNFRQLMGLTFCQMRNDSLRSTSTRSSPVKSYSKS